jgi:hypothetical protein
MLSIAVTATAFLVTVCSVCMIGMLLIMIDDHPPW